MHPGLTGVQPFTGFHDESDHSIFVFLLILSSSPRARLSRTAPTITPTTTPPSRAPPPGAWIKRAKRWCPSCGGALWQADEKRCRRIAPVEVIKRRLGKAFFDFGIFDECHELKGPTAQGTTHGILMGCCGRTISMTGSIASGYADDLHYLAAKADIRALHADGLEWGAIGPWMDRYGVRETITRIRVNDSDNVASRGSPSKHVRRKPGISPLVFSRYLMGRSVFLRLEDVAEGLPPFHEEVVQVPLGKLESPYRALERAVTSAVKAEFARGSKKLLGMMIHSLVTWPDHPFRWNGRWSAVRDGLSGVTGLTIRAPLLGRERCFLLRPGPGN